MVTFFGVALATFFNITKMCKIKKFQRIFSTIFLKLLNIYFFSKIFQKLEIELKKILREYFSCNERLEIFLTYFCNVGPVLISAATRKAKPNVKSLVPLRVGHWHMCGEVHSSPHTCYTPDPWKGQVETGGN